LERHQLGQLWTDFKAFANKPEVTARCAIEIGADDLAGVDDYIRQLSEVDPDSQAFRLAVAAALPGGDPLAAALAAGETPSPEMVAAAGEGTGLRLSVAAPLAAGILIAMAVGIFLTYRSSALSMIGVLAAACPIGRRYFPRL
jgi:hypothetical protein